jgi:heavy metal sensor kinase
MQLSFRLRLMIGYAGIVALTVTAFGMAFYVTVFDDLNTNLDSSMQRVAESLDEIIRQKQRETRQPLRPAEPPRPKRKQSTLSQQQDYFSFLREQSRRTFIGPVLPPKDTTTQKADEADVVWSAVYEHILFNPKNYYIQVADTSGAIVWRSENLVNQNSALPLPSDGMLAGDTLPFRYTLPKYPFGKSFAKTSAGKPVSTSKQMLRLFVYRTVNVQISIGYPVGEIETTLGDLFSTLLTAIPLVLLTALVGGWLLARYFVQPVEAITRTAQEITAHNLGQRIPVRQVNDEITRLAETLNEMISRLEDSFKQIRQFTGDASHELRTPLAVLMGELEIALRSPKSTEEYQDVLTSALEEVHRLSQVVQNLLELSRADSGQVQIVRDMVNLSAMLDDIYEDAMILAEERAIRVEYRAMQNVVLCGDKVRLHEALLNVVDNAIKYTHAGGRIILALECEDDDEQGRRALVSVSDTGVGIPPDDIPHIFDRFYRVDKARSKDVGGHGLGLSIVKWIVEAHHGSIHVQSHVGKGTTFFIRIPLALAEATEAVEKQLATA